MSTVNQEERIKSLESENQQLQQWVNDLQSGMYINCVYCGHRYGNRGVVPESMADILKQHIETCPKHPMSQLKAENADLRRWKEEATAVMPDFQAIGKSLGIQLGKSVSEQILPGIEALKAEIAHLRERLQAAAPLSSLPEGDQPIGLFTKEQKEYVDSVAEEDLRSHLLHQVRLRDNMEKDRDAFETETQHLREQLQTAKPLRWIKFGDENLELFNEAVRDDDYLMLFDNGYVRRGNEEKLPFAVMTHFMRIPKLNEEAPAQATQPPAEGEAVVLLKELYTLAEIVGMKVESQYWTEAFRAEYNPVMTKVEFFLANQTKK